MLQTEWVTLMMNAGDPPNGKLIYIEEMTHQESKSQFLELYKELSNGNSK